MTRLFFKVLGRLYPKLAAHIALSLFMKPPRSKRGPRETEFWESGEKVQLPSGLDARGFGNPSHPPVWILSGWGGRSSQLRSIIEALVVQNYYIISWDSPAHGNNPQTKTHMLEVAQTLKKDLSVHMNKNITLIGHSFGGAACAYAASQSSQVGKLITIASPPDVREVLYSFWRRVKLPKPAQKHFIDKVYKLIDMSPLELSMIHYFKDVKAQWLHIHDKDDEEVPISRIENFQSLNPGNVQFLITEDLGHYRILKKTRTTTKIIQFLSSGKV